MIQIGVIGAGAMGSGIAQTAAMAGHEVLLYDAHPAALIRARDAIMQSLGKLAEKNKLSGQDAKVIFGRIYFVENLESIATCGLVIEAIIEDDEVKRQLFARAEPLLSPDAILATNTSSLSVTGLAKDLQHPGRFIGIHFFNPPVMMPLVEIIPALQTHTTIREEAIRLITSWGKQPVVARDTPGFIVNRINRTFYSEALRIAEEQLAPYAVIDQAMKEIGGFKMGPFELMDFIGHDVNEAVTRSVWTATFFEPRYKPSHLQVNLVRAGWLGRKSGRGFYHYDEVREPIPDSSLGIRETIFYRIITLLIHEAADALYTGLAQKEDIEKAMVLGVNYPKGLLQWADEIGIRPCVDRMQVLYETYQEERYRCSVLLKKMADAGQTFYA